MSPPCERLDADDASALQIDLRLVLQKELVVLDRPSQLILQRNLLAFERGHLRCVGLQIVFSFVLGVIHSRIRIFEQGLEAAAVFRVNRKASAGGHGEFLLSQ